MEQDKEVVEKEDLYTYLSELMDTDVPDEDSTFCSTPQQKSDAKKYLSKCLFNETKKNDEIPEFLMCNISLDFIREPIILETGITYEKEMIQFHLNKNGNTDPVTRENLKNAPVIKNKSLQAATCNFIEHNPWAYNQRQGESWQTLDLDSN